ncbi:MAG: c-type cytochrome [Bacteriovoracaceae bacterium]|nr:c-type cytochrome [Bacteriovoracaceae bacterium]
MKFVILALLLSLVACEKTPFVESKTFAGGKVVDSATLNLGYTTYLEYCVQCHGANGDGKGVSWAGMYPAPRNLTQGLYKFANVPYGELPHDADFHRIIRKGLNGSAMLPWDISDERLDAVTQYIKTFAPQVWEGADKTLGTKIEATPDPYGPGKKAEAIARGAKVYHIVAQCTTCHRAYASKSDISNWNKEINGSPIASFDSNLYELKPQDSEYDYKVIPPDFTYHPLRSIFSTEDIYQRLLYGVSGSGMPGWKDVVADDDIWALTYYVESLRELKSNTQARDAFLKSIEGN